MKLMRPRSLADYLEILWRRKLVALAAAALIAATAFHVINRLPDVYESRALIVIPGQQSEDLKQANAGHISAATQQLTSRANLEPVIRRHGLYAGAPGPEAAVAQMLKDVKVETKLHNFFPESPVAISVGYRHPDPGSAQQVLAQIIGVFEATNEATRRQVTEEAAQVGSQIDEVEAQLRRLGRRHAGGLSSGDLGALRTQRLTLANAVASLRDQQYALERRVAEQRRQVTEQEKIAKQTLPKATTHATSAYGALLVRKVELGAQLKDFATQYTEKHPKVTQARNQLAEVDRQLAQLDAQGEGEAAFGSTPEGRELRTLQRDLGRMETELEVTRRERERRQGELDKSPAVDLAQVAAAAAGARAEAAESADANFLHNRYLSLLDKRDTLQRRLTVAGGLGPDVFRIVDPPHRPGTPVAPDRVKLRLLAAALALGLGVVLIAALEFPRLRRIEDERDVEYFLGAPVIGLIPETLTPAERGRARRLVLGRKLAVFLLGAALIPALVILFERLQVFHLLAYR